MRYLSHGIYAISDKMAGRLAKEAPRGRLPKIGYELLVIIPDGRKAWMTRVNLTMLDPVKNKRGWVWGVRAL